MSKSEHRDYWSEYSLSGIDVKNRPLDKNNFCSDPNQIPPYFSNVFQEKQNEIHPTHRGYSEARHLIGPGKIADFDFLSNQVSVIIAQIFSNIPEPSFKPIDSFSNLVSTYSQKTVRRSLVKLELSSNLEEWRESQKTIGNILPAKKFGLIKASREIINILGADDWPEIMKLNNVMYAVGFFDFLIGAVDAPTLFSNYVTSLNSAFEHGFNEVFPSLEALVEKGLLDPHAIRTVGGYERRICSRIGARYFAKKISAEKCHRSTLAYLTARLGRRDAQTLLFFDCGVVGIAADAIARGYDPAAAISDLIFCKIATDVMDVGSDIFNSEVVNAFLNTADITDTGVVSERALRRIYDAFAATLARQLTQRWHEPTGVVNILTYTWNIQNDRHLYFRRALLGWPKARKTPARPQREADLDEAFDEKYHTTGFARPLESEYECNGQDTCNFVGDFLLCNDKTTSLLRELWWFLVVGPLEYVRKGVVNEQEEQTLTEGSRLRMAQLFSEGLSLEMQWLIAHAHHHAWQVNYLNEAAMFGSILDSGELMGRLDRIENSEIELYYSNRTQEGLGFSIGAMPVPQNKKIY